MSSHSQCLLEKCRLCGFNNPSSWKDRKPLKKEKMAKVINEALGIDIEADLEGVHQHYICVCCSMKLNRWKTKTKKMKKTDKKNVKTNISIASFDGGICSSCGNEVVYKPIQKKTLAAFEDEARKAGLLTWCAGERLQIIKLTDTGEVLIHLAVSSDFSWKLTVGGIDSSHMLHQFEVTDIKQVKEVFGRNICKGNDDFEDIIERKRGPDGQVPIRVSKNDTYSPISKTIRHNECFLFVPEGSQRCDMCKIIRPNLCAIRANQSKATPTVPASSTIPNRYLSHSQLLNKSSAQQADRVHLKRKIESLQDKITEMHNKESEVLNHEQSRSMEETVAANADEFNNALPPGSAARLLFDQQLESLKKNKQMRWHPTIIRWCIALQTRSASNYDFLRSTGFLKLPHPSTLHKYSHFADPNAGFSADMLERIVRDVGLDKDGAELKRDVCLLFDEMKIKSGLYYSVRTGKIVGFTDVGSLANEVNRFERRCRGEQEPTLASHVLVIMLRGIFCDLHSPVGYYATATATSDQLFTMIWEAIEFVEIAGFQVRALVSDGASPNRKFYRIHSDPATKTTTYSTLHHLDPSRTLYFICDVPHLIKTARNNFENSGYHNNTRHLHYDKKDIKWTQVLELYEWDIGLERTSPGLRRLHKITYEHLHLTPSLRMRVYMAAQFLSSTVANALEAYGKESTESTVKFIRMFDRFFDCLNVSNCFKGIRNRKEELKEYRSSDDWRFAWLKEEFLGFLDSWESQVNNMENVPNATKKKNAA
ncbi:uncharacterized protein LOC117109202 [Anneissia japonica]|uniref:uncharacterized protein LOC117109202 n=1 Tax=Anneissia japonica TaxID=1529436 RepID=UPI001425BAD6|nr:uncharacterized protein LOC117109202 [Anneissia japonica]